MPRKSDQLQLDIKEGCVIAAKKFIAEHGAERLSLREIARCLGVSHQAPYKHYESKEHLLAEVMRRCFKEFANFLDERERNEDPSMDLYQLGLQYQKFAQSNPVEYRLMFNTPWPEQAEATGLVRDSTHAFDVLRGVLKRLYGESAGSKTRVDTVAMFIWINMHGLASITGSSVLNHLGLSKSVEKNLTKSILEMIDSALRQANVSDEH